MINMPNFASLTVHVLWAVRPSSFISYEIAVTKPSYAISMYKKGQLCGANSFDLLMMAYSEAIWGCATQNATHASAAIHVLVESLDQDDQHPLSQNLIKSYAVCLKLIEQHKFQIATDLLQALRKSWRKAYHQA